MATNREDLKKTIARRNARLKPPRKGQRDALSIVQKYHPEVTTVVDALKPIEITVNDSDSNHSKPLSVDECALAQACSRSFDGAIIGIKTAYMIKDRKATRYKLSEGITREIVTFDRHKDFAGGVYRLIPPGKAQKLGADTHHGSNGKGNAKKKERGPNHITRGIRKL